MGDDLRDYLLCEIRCNSDTTKACLGQHHLFANLEMEFGKVLITCVEPRPLELQVLELFAQ